ncbi:methyl-accepting chemotaxis protein [Pseudorhizobium endolithicum]|uniref:Methyl-accepting chemotaxis protein n=1 Tax=Pseudorhizobium endolithicum TaxID=1191678 RepID=A0ABN7JQ55_9HYPH|nr:methyl-accepting chemotaxis protein [Pseudorhizobium endolithicum]CAD7041355.1 methyl-accepting chemotaxis protein [Pseudorhizobium endolithicum]
MRDRDRLESELLELRAVADALDGSLRRLASGDIYQNIDVPFPRPFEGMRKDFNRGLDTVARSIDEIISRTRELRSEAAELGDSLRRSGEEGARRSATVSAAVAALGSAAGNSRNQSARCGHISTIVHNARLDLGRPRQAAGEAAREARQACRSLENLKMLAEDLHSVLREASFLALNTGVDAAHAGPSGATTLDMAKGLHAMTQKVGATAVAIAEAADQALGAAGSGARKMEELDREFDALNLYLEAVDSQVGALGESAEGLEASLASTRTDLAALSKKPETAEAETSHPPQFHLDAIDRAAAEIARQAGRFTPVRTLYPPLPPSPSPGSRGHLRLVKS